MTPATVRLKEDGRYELISGHRRKKACELAGLETLKCEVKELTRDEAIIIMVAVSYTHLEKEEILRRIPVWAETSPRRRKWNGVFCVSVAHHRGLRSEM